MIRRRSSRRHSPRPITTHIFPETLESRQLLSGTNDGETIIADFCSVAAVDLAAGHQYVCVSEVVGHTAHELSIDEVWEVEGELWVLSRLTETGIGATVITGVHDSVVVKSAVTAQKHFRIGGAGVEDPSDPRDELVPVDNLADFHSRLAGKSARLIYGETDPELTAWRDAIREKLITEADELYGELYGTETEITYYPLIDGGEIFFSRSTITEAQSDSLVVTLSASDTNVQVAGVDEADIVETDGEFIYILSGRELIIVRANAQNDDSPQVVSRTELNYQPEGMFLNGDRLTLIGREDNYGPIFALTRFAADIEYQPRKPQTTISVFDITNRAAPELSQDTVVDGSFISARAIGDDVYIVINNAGAPYLPTLRTIHDGRDEDGRARYRYQTREEFLVGLNRIVDNASPPATYRRTTTGSLERLDWLDDSAAEVSSGTQRNILRFNMRETAPGPVEDISIPAGSSWSAQIYASHDAIYVLTQEYEQVESGGSFFRVNQGDSYTRIAKIGISRDAMNLEGTGRVRGFIDNQFSVDEHNGYLRVATTTGQLWRQTSENHLWVLEDTGDELAVVGSVEGLAQTETIYSMRFAGDRAWMVTFRKVDPVFSFDLSDPTNPRVTGELKIPGYSDYLQLIDENHLLAIGRGTIDSGSPRFAWFQEVQVSLFDISDMQNPTLLHRFSFEGGRRGQSNALIDHHAFNYIPDRNMLAVPFSNPEDGSWQAGLITLHFDPENGITQLGDVDQPGSIRRSVRIEDQLFGVSDQHLTVMNLDDPDVVIDNVELKRETDRIRRHSNLLQKFLRRQNDIFIGRFYNRYRDADHLILGTGETPENWNEALDDAEDGDTQYKFLIRDADTNEIWDQRTTNGPLVHLSNPVADPIVSIGTEPPDVPGPVPARISVQFRTRTALVDNAKWGAWSEASVFDLAEDKPKQTSPTEFTFDDAVLRWSEVAGRGSATYFIEPWLSSPTFRDNSVARYEVWITDAMTGERVIWDRDVPDPERDLSDLNPGRFWVWFRAAFDDDTFGDWSEGTTVRLLGRKLNITSAFDRTADRSPQIDWDSVAGAVGYEIEVMSPDGSTVVYSETNIAEARHRLSSQLAPGTYSVRVRAQLSGVSSEWSDSFSFEIVGRPTPVVRNEFITWDHLGADRFEIWVNDRETGERIWHNKNWSAPYVDNIGQLFGKSHGDVELWVKAFLPDGSSTKWSGKVVARIFAAAMTVDPVDSFDHGQTQQLTWQPHDGVESVEVYIQREGVSGAVYRQAGIEGTAHVLQEVLSGGNYLYWIRGLLANGGWTRWGPAQSLTITNRPNVAASGETIGWTTAVNTIRSEIWINEIDERGRTIRARAAHLTDAVGDRFNTENLASGLYAVWIRTFDNIAGAIIESEWSQRYLLELARPPGTTLDPFQGKSLDELLGVLDQL